jgi:tripartite-type tricarboxylate transporter receptor subunit TctC
MVLVVRHDSPYKSLADIVSAAKAKPGGLKQAVAGLGTVGHLAGEMLARNAGIKVLTIPYKGASPAATELLGGLTDFMFATPQSVLGLVQSDRLRILAVTSLKRSPVLPNVPTVSESGYKGFEAVDWKVIVAPTGTPPEVIKRLNAAIEKALATPKMQAQLAAESSTGLGGSPEKAAQFISAQQVEWGVLVREAGIRFD